jgi:hypothetical protein
MGELCRLIWCAIADLFQSRAALQAELDPTEKSSPAGKLEVLNIECDKCGRRGRYRLDRLIERYGIDAKLFDWSDEVTADCPRKQARNLNDQCGARCPDLPKVV